MPYHSSIRIEFDPRKDAENQTKHGASLAFGAEVLSDPRRLDVFDIRYDYGEIRVMSLGLVEDRLWVCVFVLRGDAHRIVSVRKANERERRRYRNTPR